MWLRSLHSQPFTYYEKGIVSYRRSFHELVKYWRQSVWATGVLRVSYEKLAMAPARTLRQILRFLGLRFAALLHRRPKKASAAGNSWEDAHSPPHQRGVGSWKL